MSYIMQHAGEAERIRFKTDRLVTRHHLDWIGLTAGQSFVDFGCAGGEVVREAAALVGSGRVVGVDGDPAMLAAAHAESARLGLTNVAYQHAWIAGPGSTGLASDAYDHAWSRFFLEYQREPLEVVKEMARVVRPGGKVSLIDIDGNCTLHFPLPAGLQAELEEVVRDLATTGFDPHAGRKLRTYAERAGLVDIREAIEPYHRIVGKPDERTAEAWRRKIDAIKQNYTTKLFPEKAHKAPFFDAFLDFILRDDTMSWSVLYLVQGTKPS